MKKHVLLIAFVLGLLNVSFANEKNKKSILTNNDTNRYGYMQPFKFIERGVEFYIFPNGDFDFNTHSQYRRSPRRTTSINISYGAPRSYNNHGVTIEHDRLGRVRRVGNVFINYDAFDRIKRVGSVYMNYNRNLIRNIGGLHIYYDRYHRIIRTTGYIKHNLSCHFCGVRNCHTNHYNSHNHNNGHGHHGHNNWNGNTMYYKNGKSKKKPNKR